MPRTPLWFRQRAPGDQQGAESAGHQPARQTHRLHQRRAGTRLGKSGHHGLPGDQGRRRQSRANDLDLLFSGKKTMSGIPIKSCVNADQTRVDFLDLSHWGRAVMKDIDFFEVGGQTVFPIYGASGGLSASFIFYFDTGFQVWNDSPRSGSYIDALARPSGY